MKNPPNISVDPINLQVADILNRAADLLVSEGWQICDIGEIGQPKCALGAINAAAFGRTSQRGELDSHAVELANKGYTAMTRAVNGLCGWNNRQTDGQVVIDKMREVANSLVKEPDFLRWPA